KDRVFTEVTLDEFHALDRLEVQEIERNDRAVELPGGRPARAGRLGREAAAQVLAPGAGCRPEVHDELSRTDEAERLVDFLELVGGARGSPPSPRASRTGR